MKQAVLKLVLAGIKDEKCFSFCVFPFAICNEIMRYYYDTFYPSNNYFLFKPVG